MASTRTARELLVALHDAVSADPAGPSEAARLFAINAVYEVPYAESLGIPWRYRGRDEVSQLLADQRQLFPRRELHDVIVVAEAADSLVAEYQFTARSSTTGRMIHQLIVARLESTAGEIVRLRETVNLVELALALYPQGLADYRVPHDRGT